LAHTWLSKSAFSKNFKIFLRKKRCHWWPLDHSKNICKSDKATYYSSPRARPPHFGNRYHFRGVMLIVIFGKVYIPRVRQCVIAVWRWQLFMCYHSFYAPTHHFTCPKNEKCEKHWPTLIPCHVFTCHYISIIFGTYVIEYVSILKHISK
jgi:hypothetical protein